MQIILDKSEIENLRNCNNLFEDLSNQIKSLFERYKEKEENNTECLADEVKAEFQKLLTDCEGIKKNLNELWNKKS